MSTEKLCLGQYQHCNNQWKAQLIAIMESDGNIQPITELLGRQLVCISSKRDKFTAGAMNDKTSKY
jgi:hypothetical protein